MSFASLNLNPAIAQAVAAAGYTDPTAVQAQAIPDAIAGHDLMVSAPTGTGKTAAFVLPALQRIGTAPAKHGRGPRVLVLTPTRELALQVTDAVSKYSKGMRQVRTGTVLGGMPYPKQRKLLDSPLDILVATPGRLIDFMEQGKVDFSRLELLVLDEADRMLDMGFIKPVEMIAAATPATRQTLLFSATLDGGIGQLGKRLLRNPKLIEVAAPKARHENIEQRLHYVDDGSHKGRLLDHFLRDVALDQAIVFTATKRGADRLASKLYEDGHAAAALHGDMNQSQRNRTLAKMRSGNVRVLVATDVAARGIDVKTISHVINYDLPKVAEDYVHRIGRTGRAGANGIAISFAAPDDGWQVRQIERYTGHAIAAHVVAGMEPKVPQRSSHKPAGRPGNSGKTGKGGGYAGRGAGAGRPAPGTAGRWSKPAGGPAASRGKPERSYSSFRGR
ncbi:MAG TPA: DEAD/DEAH box helicase [Burkholderiales bacterium]|nr:DEAD/DEAH box helicase [Burkholderiales bacterium]